MKLEVAISKTINSKTHHPITCAMEIDGKFQQSISSEVAEEMIKIFGLKFIEKVPTTKLNSNEGFFDNFYA